MQLRTLIFGGALAGALAMTAAALSPTLATAEERGQQIYSARGLVKSFAAERRSVSIAHEAIPGFMGAMTMSFDVSSESQLRELAVNDQVHFSFTVTAGRRILQTITKAPR